MRKLSCSKGLQRLCLFPPASCLSTTITNNTKNKHHNTHSNVDFSPEENEPLIIMSTDQTNKASSSLKLKDIIAGSGTPTLAFHLKPKMVVMRVSMHCGGCARKVEKHISKLEGVTAYQVDLETKMVVVTGDIVPFDVLESVSKVKFAELWDD